jgi:hypothetical protein
VRRGAREAVALVAIVVLVVSSAGCGASKGGGGPPRAPACDLGCRCFDEASCGAGCACRSGVGLRPEPCTEAAGGIVCDNGLR